MRKFQISNFKFQISGGFTIIELLLVIGIFGILAAFATINLITPQTKASVFTSTSVLVTDLKEQQIKAISGDSDEKASSQPYGIYIEPTRYTLFSGSNYSSADPSNFTINLDQNMNLSTTFSGGQIIFSKRSGEVANFNPSANTITVTNSGSGESKTMTINRLGVISVN